MSALESALGTEGATRHAPVDFEGHAIEATFVPPDAEALGEGLRALSDEGLAAIVRGAGLHSGAGCVPKRADVFLSTERFAGVQELEPAEGVCQVGAGTRLAELRRALEPTGWEIPIDAPDDATVGGVLASAAHGPRSHGFGPVRDAVLGLDVVLASGERTRCGGRVVKNVTGYDLAKLYVGSLGTLGVITGAWLRLRPRPEAAQTLRLEASDPVTAAQRALEVSRHVAVRACGWTSDPAGRCRVTLELASDAASVSAATAALELGECAGGDLAELAPTLEPGAVRLRIPALPSQQAAVVEALGAAAACVAFPGLRFVLADFAPEADPASVFAAGEAAAREGCGLLRCESAAASVKAGRSVLGVTPAEARLAHAIKAQFDPAGTLAPGRLGEAR